MNHRSFLTVLTLIGTLLGAGVAAHAETAPPAAESAPVGAPTGKHHAGMMKQAMRGLNVTPAEMLQIRAAQQKFKSSQGTSTPETHAQLKADIEAALTPEQRTGFESNLKSLMAQRRAARKAGAGAPAPQAT